MPRPSTPTFFGHPAQAEPAYHDGGAVEYIGNSLFRAGDNLIHSNVILLDPAI
jgi:hypothetical protein